MPTEPEIALPEANVEWSAIPADARVTELRHVFVVRFADGREAVANWSSGDAREAQTWLRARAATDAGDRS